MSDYFGLTRDPEFAETASGCHFKIGEGPGEICPVNLQTLMEAAKLVQNGAAGRIDHKEFVRRCQEIVDLIEHAEALPNFLAQHSRGFRDPFAERKGSVLA